jgi:transcriptional regulator GlxA family with amidase domain
MIGDVVAVVHERAAAFELGLVCQVFGLDRSDDGLPTYDFDVCTPVPGLVSTTSGFAIEVEHGLERLERADLVTVPAWPQLDTVAPPALLVEALHAAVARGARVLSICTGAFLLAAAGLLDGRRATTHWQFTDRLARRYPQIQVDPDVLYVEDGQVLTGAGASAGIDACLHVVRSEFGSRTANALARRMVVPAHRSGGQAQYIEMPVQDVRDSYQLPALIDWIQLHLDRPLTVEALAARAAMSPRSFARWFKTVTGTTPHRWLLEQRLRRAEELLESSDLPIERVALRAGFGSADTLRHHFVRLRRVSPMTHRLMFRADAHLDSPQAGPVRAGVPVAP